MDFGCSIDQLDRDEYEIVVEWVKESVEAQGRSADDGPSIDMDAEGWEQKIVR